MWDDGLAEVSLYEAKRPQYGKIRSYEAVFIVVKEDLNSQPYEGKSLLQVLKLNEAHNYWTEDYPYNYKLNVFARRDDPTALVKLTLGSQEWCGNTFKMLKTWGGQPQLEYHTYFDGAGDGTRPLDLHAGDLLEDQLPLALRGLKFSPGLTAHRRVLPSLISNSMRWPLDWLDAAITVSGEEAVKTGIGRRAAGKVDVKMGALQQTWWFGKDAPHALLRMDSSDGRVWLLKNQTRKAHWREPPYRPKTGD